MQRRPRNRADGQLILDMLETGDIRMNCNDGSEWCAPWYFYTY